MHAAPFLFLVDQAGIHQLAQVERQGGSGSAQLRLQLADRHPLVASPDEYTEQFQPMFVAERCEALRGTDKFVHDRNYITTNIVL